MRTSQSTDQGGKRGKIRGFSHYMQEKLALAVVVITLALFALIYVLYHIIQENQDSYNQIVLSQQDYDSRPIPFRRGDIVDRNGTYLATTQKVYNLIIDPRQIMSDEADYLNASVNALVEAFGYDPATIRSLITDNPDSQYIRYARQLEYDQMNAFEELRTQTNQNFAASGSKERIRGVWFEEEYKRVYPYNALACNVIGFVTGDGASGATGIENSYNDSLTGINGREYGYLNDESNLERVIKPASNGDTLVSTIDVNIQNVVEKHIREWMGDPGSDRIGVVVMNPNNGEVLAMASDQSYDLNNPRDIGDRFTAEEIREFGLKEARDTYNRQHPDDTPITIEQVPDHFTSDEIDSYGQQVAWNQMWRNFCISDTYEPGSPQKIFTVSGAMEEGVLTGRESFLCDGYQEVGGWRIRCVNRNGHGQLTVAESLMQSCNDAMMQIAAMTGRSRFVKYQKMFGFGSKTGIDLPGEADASALVYDETNMNSSALATNSFGQNYNCTMIQMAAAYCSVINGGSYYEPHVVRQILNEQGAVVKKMEPRLVRETVSESTASFIREALFQTVEAGTGSAAAVEGYEIAGKTGTAQKIPRAERNYVVSFCGFAPAHDPQVLVYVVIDTPHVEDQPHSTFASGVFQKIMAEILPYLNVFPAVDPQVSGDESLALPPQEGITDNTGVSQGEEPAETEAPKVYETEEYVSQGEEDDGFPAELPGMDPLEEAQAETEEVIQLDTEETSGESAESPGE